MAPLRSVFSFGVSSWAISVYVADGVSWGCDYWYLYSLSFHLLARCLWGERTWFSSTTANEHVHILMWNFVIKKNVPLFLPRPQTKRFITVSCISATIRMERELMKRKSRDSRVQCWIITTTKRPDKTRATTSHPRTRTKRLIESKHQRRRMKRKEYTLRDL